MKTLFEIKKIDVGTTEYKIKLFCLFDLCALNCILGKQNHSSTYPDAWTDVTKAHLSYAKHNGTPHTKESCKDSIWNNLHHHSKAFKDPPAETLAS